MKNFFTSLLGSLVALMLFAGGAVVLFFIVIGVLAAIGEKQVKVEPGSYIVFDLGVNITDAPQQFDGAAIMAALTGGGEPTSLQLRDVTNALRAAAKDDRIAGVFIHGEFEPAGYGTGFAALKEVREALATVKAAGKPVHSFLEYAGAREFYLASAADDVAFDPYGMLMFSGLATQPMFFAGAFERFGIGVQVTRVGKYKSAVEPFVRKDLSPENREQLQKLLDDLWTEIRDGIADDRGLSPEKVQAMVDAGEGLRADEALKAGIVTRVIYRDEMIAELKEKTGRSGPKEAFKQINLANYIKVAPDAGGAKPENGDDEKPGKRGRIAIVYAEGTIVDGEGEVGEVSGEKYSRELRRLRQDDNVKAIVLRVNSPGGSAAASERIQREIRLARQEKPVIVSMGSYAASGGYWISTYGNRIFAEPSTITGSIGVFGMFFNAQKLANDLGFTFDVVKTGKFADSLTIARPQTPEELARWQNWVDWIYDEFLRKVAESRELDRDQVHEIAQGRVWSGAEAVKLGLVDEIGGLDAALAYAAKEASLGEDYRVVEYPRKKELAEAIAEMFEGFKPATSRAGSVTQVIERVRDELKVVEQFNDPRGVYARLPVEVYLR